MGYDHAAPTTVMDLPIVHPEVERYLHDITPASEPVLRDLEARAAQLRFPIVGPLVGRLLFVLARALGAETVLELGSGFGYSALWFALALEEGGRVVLTEKDPANVALARDSFARAGLLERAAFETGDALEVAATYPGPFDLVFCDIDKQDYPRAFAVGLERVRRGGLLVFDNALWGGRVTAEPAPDDRATRGVRELNRLLMTTPGLRTTVLPLRDGVAVAVKL